MVDKNKELIVSCQIELVINKQLHDDGLIDDDVYNKVANTILMNINKLQYGS